MALLPVLARERGLGPLLLVFLVQYAQDAHGLRDGDVGVGVEGVTVENQV